MISNLYNLTSHTHLANWSEQPTDATISGQETNTLQSSMQHADTMYQPLSKDLVSSSVYTKMKHPQSTQPVQSVQHAPNANTTYQPLSKEFMSSPSTYAEMKHPSSTQPVLLHVPNADTMYQPLYIWRDETSCALVIKIIMSLWCSNLC